MIWPVVVIVSDSSAGKISVGDYGADPFHKKLHGVVAEQTLKTPVRLRVVQRERRPMDRPVHQVPVRVLALFISMPGSVQRAQYLARIAWHVDSALWPVAVGIPDSSAGEIGIADYGPDSSDEKTYGVAAAQILEAPIRLRVVQREQRPMDPPVHQVSHHRMLRLARKRLQAIRPEETKVQRLRT